MNTTSKELATVPGPSVALMLQGALDNIKSGDITPQHVDVLGKMMELYERNEKREAEKSFAAAFIKLQATMPQIVASKAVPGNDGTTRYKYAPYEEIMTKARATLNECGFAITFDTEIAEGRAIVTCSLIHSGGHSRATKFACRIGSGPPKASEAQGDGAAVTYAKRFALCAALNIVVEHDDDARVTGAPISQEQADDLRRRVKATSANEANFLKFAEAATYEAIPETRFESLDELLRKREAKAAAHPPGERDSDGNFKF